MNQSNNILEELKTKLYAPADQFDVTVIDALVQYAMSGDKFLVTFVFIVISF